jgi:hypothetical protein
MILSPQFSACNFVTDLVLSTSSLGPCPISTASDDEVFDAAEEFLNEQYDREIQEFYLNARDQALARHGTAQHVHEEHQVVPD